MTNQKPDKKLFILHIIFKFVSCIFWIVNKMSNIYYSCLLLNILVFIHYNNIFTLKFNLLNKTNYNNKLEIIVIKLYALILARETPQWPTRQPVSPH